MTKITRNLDFFVFFKQKYYSLDIHPWYWWCHQMVQGYLQTLTYSVYIMQYSESRKNNSLRSMIPTKATTFKFQHLYNTISNSSWARCFHQPWLQNDLFWSLHVGYNVLCIKNRTKYSSKTLLSLVRFLMHQTLLCNYHANVLIHSLKVGVFWVALLTIENEKKSHLYALIWDYSFINFQQKVPPIRLFSPIFLLLF